MTGIIYWIYDPANGDKQVGIFNKYFTENDGNVTTEMALIRSTGYTTSGDLVGQASPRTAMMVALGKITDHGVASGALYAISEQYQEAYDVSLSITNAVVDPVTGQINLTT